MKRCGGVLMHISSLPGKYGIGTLGENAKKFADFLHNCKFKVWQVLPCGPCDEYNSPYSGKSAFAGNIYFIDPEMLYNEFLLTEEDLNKCECDDIYVTGYEFLYKTREEIFRKAFDRFQNREKVLDFAKENPWVEDYALFCALKKENSAPWYEWEDGIKKRTAEALETLKKLGIKETSMLTGDRYGVARKVAGAIGIDAVYAELLPEGKVKKVEEMLTGIARRGKLVYVGDGINDAPVLSRADVGIAMGAMGSDAAIEAADVVIMDDRLNKLPEAVNIARQTRKIVMQNIVMTLGVKGVILVLGALGFAGMWAAVFADVGIMVIAVLNAMRMLAE